MLRVSVSRHSITSARRVARVSPPTSRSTVVMSNPFFDHPTLNSPYAPPARHWELDDRLKREMTSLFLPQIADWIDTPPNGSGMA
jgi:hypothetical protein